MPKQPAISRQTSVYAASGAVLGAMLRYLLGTIWPIPPAFPAPPGFPTAGVVVSSVTVGLALFGAGFIFTARRPSRAHVFVFGVCAGIASLSQYAVIGVSALASAGVLLLVLAPILGLVGFAAGMFSALAVAGHSAPVDDAVAE